MFILDPKYIPTKKSLRFVTADVPSSGLAYVKWILKFKNTSTSYTFI